MSIDVLRDASTAFAAPVKPTACLVQHRSTLIPKLGVDRCSAGANCNHASLSHASCAWRVPGRILLALPALAPASASAAIDLPSPGCRRDGRALQEHGY